MMPCDSSLLEDRHEQDADDDQADRDFEGETRVGRSIPRGQLGRDGLPRRNAYSPFGDQVVG